MNLRESLLHAKAKGIARPKIRLDDYQFCLAPPHGRNPDAIYIVDKNTAEYYGKINPDNSLSLVRKPSSFTTDLGFTLRIRELIDNPEVHASAYGRMTGECCICGRTLTAKESIRNHIGPICASKYGFGYTDEPEELEAPPSSIDIPDDF